jgi:DNA-binding NtrC family response regulator
MASGDELLIVDSAERDREGMRKVFDDEGYVCTAVATGDDARDLVGRKFFPAALIDLDVDRPGGGIEIARSLREKSRQTAIVILTTRRSFEAAVEAIRAGCIDVVVKRPEEVPHLKRIIAIAADRYRAGDKSGTLLRDVKQVVDDAIKIMIDMARVVYADTSSLGSGKEAATPRAAPKILVIDADSSFLKEIAQAMGQNDWEIAAEMTGGSALDKAGEHKFDIVACRDDLPDLPGSMVLKSIQAQRPEMVGLLYSAPGGGGRIERWEQERTTNVERPFKGAAHLVQKIAELASEKGSIERDRRVIQKFRSEHADFLRRWAEIKSRFDAL